MELVDPIEFKKEDNEPKLEDFDNLRDFTIELTEYFKTYLLEKHDIRFYNWLKSPASFGVYGEAIEAKEMFKAETIELIISNLKEEMEDNYVLYPYVLTKMVDKDTNKMYYVLRGCSVKEKYLHWSNT